MRCARCGVHKLSAKNWSTRADVCWNCIELMEDFDPTTGDHVFQVPINRNPIRLKNKTSGKVEFFRPTECRMAVTTEDMERIRQNIALENDLRFGILTGCGTSRNTGSSVFENAAAGGASTDAVEISSKLFTVRVLALALFIYSGRMAFSSGLTSESSVIFAVSTIFLYASFRWMKSRRSGPGSGAE